MVINWERPLSVFLKDNKTEKFTISSHGCVESKERTNGLEIFTFSQVEASYLNQLAATLLAGLILH